LKRGFQRSGAAGGAVDRLQAAQDRGAQVGVRRAGLLGADLLLQIQVELAIDAGDADAAPIAPETVWTWFDGLRT